nr:MAG: capsid protein [Cressdnaviricota sp.]
MNVRSFGSSLSKYPRKRYNFKKNFVKKARFGKYGKFKTNVSKYLKTDENMIKCEFNDFLQTVSGSNTFAWGTSSEPYVNITTAIQATAGWSDFAANYSFYKIKGIAIRLGRVWDGLGAVAATGSVPVLYINMFPGMTSTGNGAYVAAADSSFRVDPMVTSVQSRYIRIPDNFSSGNGNGLGENNNVSSISNLVGELDTYPAGLSGNFNATKIFYEARVTFYVVFCNNVR